MNPTTAIPPLTYHIVGGRLPAHLRIVRTGAVDHDQSECRQEDDDHKKVIIIEAAGFLFPSFLFLFGLSPHLHLLSAEHLLPLLHFLALLHQKLFPALSFLLAFRPFSFDLLALHLLSGHLLALHLLTFCLLALYRLSLCLCPAAGFSNLFRATLSLHYRALTHSLKIRPRSSKFLNIPQLAHAGESST